VLTFVVPRVERPAWVHPDDEPAPAEDHVAHLG
jgi:hypothetical protein